METFAGAEIIPGFPPAGIYNVPWSSKATGARRHKPMIIRAYRGAQYVSLDRTLAAIGTLISSGDEGFTDQKLDDSGKP